MAILISHFLILIYCFLGFSFQEITWQSVIGFLCPVTLASLFYVLQNKRFSNIFLLLYFIIVPFFPTLLFFTPLLFFEMGRTGNYFCMFLCFLEAYMLLCPDWQFFFFLIFGFAFALFLEYLTVRYENLEQQYRHMRDDGVERNLLLKARNQALLENQDYEIHNATLRERNRIAREIHDNVGHMLSRCILMAGALQAVNKEESFAESLRLLQETLSQAMDNIRNSVHNLHDDSVNLQKNMQDTVETFTYCKIRFDYDIQTEAPIAVRYAFIAIFKEALTNVTKHSNASLVTVIAREHPAMYQLIIHDNGSCLDQKTSVSNRKGCWETGNGENGRQGNGIGIANMYDRVAMLNGILQISQNHGFQVFVSIPKNQPERKEEGQYEYSNRR